MLAKALSAVIESSDGLVEPVARQSRPKKDVCPLRERGANSTFRTKNLSSKRLDDA